MPVLPALVFLSLPSPSLVALVLPSLFARLPGPLVVQAVQGLVWDAEADQNEKGNAEKYEFEKIRHEKRQPMDE